MVLNRHLALVAAVVLSASHLIAGNLPGDYFPAGKLDSFTVNEWYGKYLASMGEPSLYKIAQSNSSAQLYRVTYFPPCSPFVALTLEVRSDERGLLKLKKMEQVEVNGGYVPGRMVRQALIIIPARSVSHFQALLTSINFWQLPADPAPEGPGALGADMFLYESAWHGKYHVVQVPDPGHHELIGPGLYLMSLAGEREPD